MKRSDTFSGCHPLINMLWFAQVIVFSMLFMHPLCLCISFSCAFSYAVSLNGKKTLRLALTFMLPMLIVTSLLNPVFSHQGVTIITYLPDGNPLTLESIIYGVAAAVMMVTVVCWFSCYNTVMTSDKFVYLFGRIIPALSLVLSMALRFVPRFQAQIKAVANAQRCIGRDVSQGGMLRRAKNGIRILSITVTWALENAIETADSMKSRGYGLSGRTAFSIYRFDKRDKLSLAFLLTCGAYIITGAILGGFDFFYYPAIYTEWSAYTFTLFAVYAALCAFPLIVNRKEAVKWNRTQANRL